VRAQVQAGLEAGLNPRRVARALDIALAPNQAAAVTRFEAELVAGNRAALQRKLLTHMARDESGKLIRTPTRDFKTLNAKLGKVPLSREQIDKMVARYRERMVAFNAESHARTAALDAQRLGQRLSIEGMYDPDKLYHTWHTVGDDRVRDEHADVDGQTVPWDQPYTVIVDGVAVSEMYPGEMEYNCRCGETFAEHKPELVERSEMARKEAVAERQAKEESKKMRRKIPV
jgi:hypothetical protein